MSDTKTVLVVEDDPTLQETLAYNLVREGYRIVKARDGRAALDLAHREKPDLILLDLMLPEMDGFEVCRAIRREMQTPILILTAREGEVDMVLGLELGADDYVTKPFALRPLLARMKALLRRSEVSNGAAVSEIAFGSHVLDMAGRRLLQGTSVVALTMKEYDLLAYFVAHPGLVLSRDFLLSRVWGFDFVGDGRTVDVHVRRLREKIEDDPGNPRHIITVRGVGYRFEGTMQRDDVASD